jgi:glycosyltransferase involved in cell wall biosynthesis
LISAAGGQPSLVKRVRLSFGAFPWQYGVGRLDVERVWAARAPCSRGLVHSTPLQKKKMSHERLKILYVSPLPPMSPPRFGAQARVHGLITNLARRHDVTAISLIDRGFDVEECRRAMTAYCRDVVLVPNPHGLDGVAKRALQLRSLASPRSFEHHHFAVPALQETLDRVQRGTRFDVVNLEFPYHAYLRLRQSPPGTPSPPLVLDAHEIAYDVVRQVAHGDVGVSRRLYARLNWRKLRGDECAAFRAADGICACSAADQARVLAHVPTARTAVIPNAADVDFYQPRSSDPSSDGRTVVFFGLLSTLQNIEGVRFFVQEIWPLVAARRSDARVKIIGARPPQAVRELAGPRVEITGFVDDLRPHLASAAVLVVPLRLGGGTRLKIVEGMAMGRPIVSTTLGAEGIEAVNERDILIADEPSSFAAAVVRLLDDPALAARIGSSARRLAVERYSWAAAARKLEQFFADVIAARGSSKPGVGDRP